LGKVKPKIRELGIALEDIPAGKSGRAIFRGEEIEVEAYEYVRSYHEIWCVGYSSGGLPLVTEHTPQELKFEEIDGTPRRVTENYPLPVSMGRKPVTYITVICTASGNTELISAPGAGNKIRVHYFGYSNKHSGLAEVGMRFGSNGDIKHRYALAPEGGNICSNLTDCCWDGGENEALYAYLAGSYSGGVIFNIGYTIEKVS